jgi:hypothetical protein
MPRSEFGRSDDRVPIGEGDERRVARHEPVGFGNNKCPENRVVVVSIFEHLNVDTGEVQKFCSLTNHA